MKKVSESAVPALVLITVGILTILEFSLSGPSIWGNYWWVIFFALTLGFILTYPNTKALFPILIFGGLGVIFVLQEFTTWNIWGYVFGALLIFFGLVLLFGKGTGVFSKSKKGGSSLFSSNVQSVDSISENTSYSAIFGEGIYDFRNAKLSGDIVINLFCMFGELKLKFSENIEIENRLSSLFGDAKVYHKSNTTNRSDAKVVISGTVMFGGISIE